MAVQIAVLSDLHVDAELDPGSLDCAKDAFVAARDCGADHVVVCGDLFDSATAMRQDARALRRFLREEGLWTPARLTVVVGNHDVFEIGHLRRSGVLAAALEGGCDRALRRFERWAADLAHDADRANRNVLYPFAKRVGPVQLLAANTVASAYFESASGFWDEGDDDRLRDLLGTSDERRVLAIHHPPRRDEPLSLREIALGALSLDVTELLERPRGFPAGDLARLRRFVRDMHVDAVVCGHVHGERLGTGPVGPARFFREGRTGDRRTFGVLSVPADGEPAYRSVRF
jgi:3',5'-cyclic AMP phosphodiesterase CpdA